MLVTKLNAVIKEKGLLKRGEKVLVGVSGGVDSLALLRALYDLSEVEGWQVYAAHLNHQFRGEEAEEDARFVEEYCRDYGIPCRVEERNVPEWIRETGANPQAAARQVRYQFFQEVASQWGIRKLALAHHANDQAETILMRVFRGTGIEGIAGIPDSRAWGPLTIIRPLLSFYKDDLEKYCQLQGITPRVDSSNLKKKYHRNFLRLEVIPWLEKEVNPSIQEALIQLGMIASEENDYFERISTEMLESIMKSKEENKIVIKGKLFLSMHLALQRRMIKLIFNYLDRKQANIGFIHIESILEWMRHGRNASRLELPQGIQAFKEYDEVTFSTKLTHYGEQTESYCYNMEVPGRTYIREINAWLYARIIEGESTLIEPRSGYEALFDLDQVKGGLTVRSRRPGDRIIPFGMEGTKKVKDLFIDEKVPKQLRERIPMIADNEGLLWIPGLKRSNRARITETTQKQLLLQYDTDVLL
ncbi:tRNA lysidine(34) synthetase TilS [Ammoniphilus sp. CFH 90114]|uniref:tRNA lysidine(34) synthetase TilS n=1 Tax=Ammoniphilus sp. CFH 90114 TaxID=2493665 RepID=UPI00100EEB0E|nr:tRNA lysidine(34) synthetase TilS [Ammoniphilus sp. CFH 90114]RXT09016.1 tRNA lysidine(34) synthetase TilS [Ammoniphilus sp. CFH 90114]